MRWLRHQERGAVAVLVAITLGGGVLLGSSALVVDVGQLYTEREQLTSGADAASLAVAQQCALGKCDTPTDAASQWPTARKYADVNAKDRHTLVTTLCGNVGALAACPAPSGGALTRCIGDPPTDGYVEVRTATEMADGSTLLPPTFARAMLNNSEYRGKSVSVCSRTSVKTFCATAAEATYHHTFDGAAGTATITADRPLCPGEQQPVTLVSYTTPADTYSVPQYVYDTQTTPITPTTPSVTFTVDVPDCYTQVDFVFTAKPINPLTGGEKYDDYKVGSPNAPGNRSKGKPGWYNGGSKTCTPEPTVALTPACNGTMGVRLGNGGTANVNAVFTVTAGGTSQLVQVQAGESKTVTIAAADAANVSVEDNTFHTTTGSWTQQACC